MMAVEQSLDQLRPDVIPQDQTGSGVGVRNTSGSAIGTTSNATNAAVQAGQQLQPPAEQRVLSPVNQHHSLMGDILHAIGEVLGGPSTRSQVNPQTGAIEKVPLSRSERIGNTVAMYLRGAAAGAAQHGPGAAGKAALAGAQSQQQLQQQQTQNTMEESRNVQAQLAGKASRALLAQQTAELGWRMTREKLGMDQATAENFNKMQETLAADPSNKDLGHYPSFADFLTNHPELLKQGIDPIALQGQGKLRSVVTSENGMPTGVQVYQVNPDLMKQKNKEPMEYYEMVPDAKGKPTMVKHVIPPNTMPQDKALDLVGSKNNDAMANQFKAKQLEIQSANTQSEIGLRNAQAGEARAKEKLAQSQTFTEDNPLVDEIGKGKMAIERLGYILGRKPELMAAVARAYPDFDAGKVENYIKLVADYNSSHPNTTGAALNAGNTALRHLAELHDLNTIESRVPGTKDYKAYHNKLDVVAGELAQFYKLPQTNETFRSLKGTLGGVMNRDAAIVEQAKSMSDKFSEYQNTYRQAAPSSAYQAKAPQMSAQAKEALRKLAPDQAERLQQDYLNPNIGQPNTTTAPAIPQGAAGTALGSDGKPYYVDSKGTVLGPAPAH